MPSMALMQAAATASRKVTPYPGRVTPGRAKYAERGGGGGGWGVGGSGQCSKLEVNGTYVNRNMLFVSEVWPWTERQSGFRHASTEP